MLHEKDLAASVCALKRGGRRKNKYGAKKVRSLDGYVFDSSDEYRRYQELKLAEAAGKIKNLVVHPAYPIHWPGTEKLICVTELDFEYEDANGNLHREDYKGVDTALSKVKRKLAEACYGFKVELIHRSNSATER